MDVHVPMFHFDKFSRPPLFQPSKCSTKFRYDDKAFWNNPNNSCCCRPSLPSTYSCDNPSSMINRVVYNNEVVCGNCPRPEEIQGRIRDSGDDLSHCSMDFPFEIYQCPEVRPQPFRPKSGAERCLNPSSVRYLETTNKADLKDFYQTKKKCEIALYRGKYAIDNRRKGPEIPCEDDSPKVLGDWPITVNARATKWKGGNMRPNYEICIPQPLTVLPMEFSIGSLENLPTQCKIMPVVC